MMNENNLFEGLGLIDINTPARREEVEQMFGEDKRAVWDFIKTDFFAR